MIVMPEPLSFDWDSGNIVKNLKKHQVNCQEAEEVFVNEPLIINKDLLHSAKEERYFGLGTSNSHRYLFLSFTIRNQKVRIISIRDMSQKEKKEYEKY